MQLKYDSSRRMERRGKAIGWEEAQFGYLAGFRTWRSSPYAGFEAQGEAVGQVAIRIAEDMDRRIR